MSDWPVFFITGIFSVWFLLYDLTVVFTSNLKDICLLCLRQIWVALMSQMQWCHWWCHQHHVVPKLVPNSSHASGFKWRNKSCFISFQSSCHNKWNLTLLLTLALLLLASCYTDSGTNGITWQKCYVAHFNHLDVMDAVVLFTMPLASHDADVRLSSVKWLKIIMLDLTDYHGLTCSGAINDAVSVILYHTGITWAKKSCTLFHLPQANKHNGAINNTICVMCFWH